jgi:hypothetical protein
MQHLVYQVLTRGAGDLAAEGTTLNAVSPWIESFRTVSMEDAPLVGRERPTRIVKTHLPLELCPFDSRARYIYVARHPAACFASCVEFVRGNLQGFGPSWEESAHWFTSDELMWWGTWPAHVGHWLARAEREDNVLVVRYEDLSYDLAAEVQRVAAFLGLQPLLPSELAAVVEKCSLESMRRQQEVFEMHPPHLLQSEHAFFRRGGRDRTGSVPPEIAARVLDRCREQIAARRWPVEQLYPDLAPGKVA